MGYKKRYRVNELEPVGKGDVIVLATDGFFEHADGAFYPGQVEEILVAGAEASAEDLCRRLDSRMREMAPPDDDVTFVLIKKTA